MKTKSILFASCVAAITLSASVAMAGGHGGRGGGFGGGGARGGGFRGGAGFAGMRPVLARGGSRFGPGMSRNFRGDRVFRHGRGFDDRFVFFGDFGDPFFYDSFYYGYPYGYGYYPYGYNPYGYGYGGYGGYGYDSYDQPGYRGYPGGRGSSVREIQMRLARAGYYRGPIDGVMGARTRYAIRAYQRSHSSRVTAR